MRGPRRVVAPASSSLSRRSKSSSKSERDSVCIVSSDRFESDPTGSGAARVEVASKMDILSICPARSGSSSSSRLSMNTSRLLRQVGVEASGFLESTRWLLKEASPDPR
jgi:hypothetical protein